VLRPEPADLGVGGGPLGGYAVPEKATPGPLRTVKRPVLPTPNRAGKGVSVADNARPKPPRGLGTHGRDLWLAIIGELEDDWRLDARELHLLERAARCADEMAILEATIDEQGPTVKGSRGQIVVHPALQEARQLRLTQQRLLKDLELVDPATVREREPLSTQRARAAANARHSKSRLAAV
jgi:P27 family predicted phage terminase small subunit